RRAGTPLGHRRALRAGARLRLLFGDQGPAPVLRLASPGLALLLQPGHRARAARRAVRVRPGAAPLVSRRARGTDGDRPALGDRGPPGLALDARSGSGAVADALAAAHPARPPGAHAVDRRHQPPRRHRPAAPGVGPPEASKPGEARGYATW